ncbi:MAG: histidine triad nucleotide-binding protein [Fibrobacteraceae bacterium]|jgi:histidine triad (HIT) family protein|nr:histidine triad nucleotide-binding protein [Fibrobacteraceae bacterium]MEE1276552.1 histidine triad nucleotide-binding protein [Fibrobacteraceae bacterium]
MMSENCLFCKIIRGEIPSKKIYEDDDVFAFYDIEPQAPVHFLVVPKHHIPTLMDMQPCDSEIMGKLLYRAQVLAKELGLEESGARFVFNCKAEAGQTVFHIHLHVLGGRQMGWPPYPPENH